MMDGYTIEKIENSDKKSEIVNEILRDLPDWFGIEASLNEYVESAKNLELWAAKNDVEIIGFVAIGATSEYTCEINSMGIKKEFHRKGIGRKLLSTAEKALKDKYKLIQVKTVDEGRYLEYDRTIAFYESMGFIRLEVFPSLWDDWNPCLVLVKQM